MTESMSKARAVLLAFVMVSSVMVGTIAFTGGAAAASGGSFTQFTNTTVDEQTTQTHTVRFTADDTDSDTNTNTFILTLPDEGNISGTPTINTLTANGSDISGSATTSLNDPDGDGSSEEVVVTVPDGNNTGTTNIVANLSVDVTWASVTSDASRTAQGTFTDDAGSVSNSQSITINDVTGPGGATRAGTGGTGSFDTRNGTGTIYPGAIVFQGEGDINFAGDLS
ncbi:MAG: surface glycoprotein, partial [Haloferacaceae archaeon]